MYIRCNEIYSSSDAFLHSIWFYDQKKDDKLIITFFDLYFRKRISSIKFLSPCFILKKFLVQVKVYLIMIPFTFIYSWMNGYFSQMRIDGTGFHWIGPTGNEVFLFYYSAHLFSNKLYSLAPFNVIHKTRKDKRIRVSSIFIIACSICLPRFSYRWYLHSHKMLSMW